MKRSLGAKTLLYPTPVLVVGTYDKNGRPNVMTAAWGGICCSRPPCVTVSLREATYSHGNIVARKAFTISIPSEDQVKHADYFGMVCGRNVDKFAESGLTPVKSGSRTRRTSGSSRSSSSAGWPTSSSSGCTRSSWARCWT